ncbi:glycosyltransferase family 2 protein [uncultured Exiguobacterium sp.]|uniref:glycosyltransferase family 2 protein n=1 Tax=uncultured Exiguobacterium sp. TaxID=202669 RepID=UPI0025F27C70|nr:glycosyltransferase family 2 protein [uncultured Exiguobacterium sp.]
MGLNIASLPKDYEVLNEKRLRRHVAVTVIIPVYNAITYLDRTINSVLVQTIGIRNVTIIAVDDKSTDGSRRLLRRLSALYPQLVSILLKYNTGTPAMPRNLGLTRARSKYVTFLDADDWLAHDGLRILSETMDRTGVDYACGRTIQVSTHQPNRIIGVHESNRNRDHVSPYTLKHAFYHLGPRARMMRRDFLLRHAIQFPSMKFAEDKQFFIDVLIRTDAISTVTAPIYYLNRLEENDSLTKQTDIMEKMETNLIVLRHVLAYNLSIEKERLILNRLIEFDCITRLYDRKHFLKSHDPSAYHQMFARVVALFTQHRSYPIDSLIEKPFNRLLYHYWNTGRFDDFMDAVKWSKSKETKEIEWADDQPYWSIPLGSDQKQMLALPLYVKVHELELTEEGLELTVQTLGDRQIHVEGITLQHRNWMEETHLLKTGVTDLKNHRYRLQVELPKQMEQGSYLVYLRFDDYGQQVMAIAMEEPVIQKSHHTYRWYETIKGNLGLRIK